MSEYRARYAIQEIIGDQTSKAVEQFHGFAERYHIPPSELAEMFSDTMHTLLPMEIINERRRLEGQLGAETLALASWNGERTIDTELNIVAGDRFYAGVSQVSREIDAALQFLVSVERPLLEAEVSRPDLRIVA